MYSSSKSVVQNVSDSDSDKEGTTANAVGMAGQPTNTAGINIVVLSKRLYIPKKTTSNEGKGGGSLLQAHKPTPRFTSK